MEVSSRLGVSPFVLVTSDIPVGLGEMEYDDFDEDFLRIPVGLGMMEYDDDENFDEDYLRIPVGLGEKDEDYVLECGHDDDAYN